MKHTLVLFACALAINSANSADVVGAGSTAAAPLYSKWEAAYNKKSGNNFGYESIGSSGGIKKIKEGSVAFGASDAPMSNEDLKKFNLLDFPTVISGVVPYVNIPGIKDGELHMTADMITGIYTGRIEKWNDPAIAAENPKLNLPNLKIVPLARADGSGTTFNYTDYLSKVSPEWRQKFGHNYTITWGSAVTAIKGTTDQVAALKKTPGAIGYAEYAYILENDLNYVQLKNRDGLYVKPNATSFKAALARSSWAKTGNFEEMLTDKPGPGSWPITGGTYVYVPRVTNTPERTAAALQFFTWAFMEGDEIANGLDYIRLPDTVQARVFHEISSVLDSQGQRLVIPIMLK